jgi:myosin-5
MSTLSASQPHYIRCIKPGKGAQAGVFDPTVVTDQLRCAGVLQTLQICAAGYPTRLAYGKFNERYV